ncbi:UNVERIFIED_CONTAM: hypothetical protein Sindi_1822000 [Sesamum indicum]
MLNSVILDGQWQWPNITDLECLEITHTLPLIYGGNDRILWRFSSGAPTSQDLYRLFDPPGPKKLPTTDKPWLFHLGAYVLCTENEMESHTHLFFRCHYSCQCLTAIRRVVRFLWPNSAWAIDVNWAARKWRGKHIINVAYRALLGSCVYHIWRERNLRRFELTKRNPTVLASLIVEDVKLRILSTSLANSVSTSALYRLWRIPWFVEGEPSI